jgi:hypothetical protein
MNAVLNFTPPSSVMAMALEPIIHAVVAAIQADNG